MFLHSPFNPAADFKVSGAVTDSQALTLQHMLRCWWEGLMLLKRFTGENIFLRRNKWGVKCPLNLFISQGCRANVPFKNSSLLAWLCLTASATLNNCSDLHPSWQPGSWILLGLVSCEKCLKQGGDLEIPEIALPVCLRVWRCHAAVSWSLSPVRLATITYMLAPLFLQCLYCLFTLISPFQARKMCSTIALLHSVKRLLLCSWAYCWFPGQDTLSLQVPPHMILNVSITPTGS